MNPKPGTMCSVCNQIIKNPDNDFHGYPRYEEVDHENIKDCLTYSPT